MTSCPNRPAVPSSSLLPPPLWFVLSVGAAQAELLSSRPLSVCLPVLQSYAQRVNDLAYFSVFVGEIGGIVHRVRGCVLSTVCWHGSCRRTPVHGGCQSCSWHIRPWKLKLWMTHCS